MDQCDGTHMNIHCELYMIETLVNLRLGYVDTVHCIGYVQRGRNKDVIHSKGYVQ